LLIGSRSRILRFLLAVASSSWPLAELVASDTLYAELAATQFLASTDTPGGLI
jgi:hypothetical protein